MTQNTLHFILKTHGPMLTSHLSILLQNLCNMTADSARKQISRRPQHIHTLAFLTFAKGARFIYLSDDYGTIKFWNALEKALDEGSKGYSLALKAVRCRDGIIPLAHFHISCGSPKRLSKHIGSETILNRMVQAKVLYLREVAGIGPCVTTSSDLSYIEDSITNLKARIITEKILLKSVESWAKNLAIGSFHKFHIRDESTANPSVGTFEWDMTSPSYLMGLTAQTENKITPGFFVCDVLMDGSTITEKAIEPFVHKLKTIKNLRKIGRLFPIFIAHRYTSDAFQKLREIGVIPATPAALFGEDVSEGLRTLLSTLRDIAGHSVHPEKFEMLFSNLSRLEGAVQTMRGAFFEYIVADLLRKTIPNAQLKMNTILNYEGKNSAEIDIILESENHVSFIECKGLNPARVIPGELIKNWLVKISVIRKWALSNPMWNGKKLKFEFWSSSDAGKSASEIYAKAKESIVKYEIVMNDRKALAIYLESVHDKKLKNVFEQHFLDYRITSITE